MALIESLDKVLINSTIEFYYIARSLLVKDEKYFDIYDQVFMKYFKDIKIPLHIHDELKKWLANPIEMLKYKIPKWLMEYFNTLDPDELARKLEMILQRQSELPDEESIWTALEIPTALYNEIKQWLADPIELNRRAVPKALSDFFGTTDPQELKRRLEKLLQEQKEKHDGGSKWIGTGGTSPFGWGGEFEGGIRIEGEGGMRMASKIAEKRSFRNYRSDRVLNTRSYKVALKKLRKLFREGREELNLDLTIKETCRNDDIEIVLQRERKNSIKLLLLMDAGGSMDPFARLVERLFSAANSETHFFKAFKYFYFHNCVYQKLYNDIEMEDYIPTAEVLKKFDSEYRVIIIGDAAMAPSELNAAYGSIYMYDESYTPGIVILKKIREKFPKSVWLNPEKLTGWKPQTRQVIERVFPMFDLTLDGIDEAIKLLI